MDLVFKTKSWWKGEWDLSYGERVVASIQMTKWTYSRAEITIGMEKWEVGFSGWLGNHLFVRDAAGQVIIEGNPRGWWGCIVDIELDKRKYTLQGNWWQTKFFVTDESGMEIVTLKPLWWKGSAQISTVRSPEDKTTLLFASILFYRYKVAEMNTPAVVVAGAVVVTGS